MAASPQDSFLQPACRWEQLDTWLIRHSILESLKATRPYFKGTLLDVGCGRMPYRGLLTNPPWSITRYIGMDLDNEYGPPELVWDGERIPLEAASIDTIMATELFEHVPEPGTLLNELGRVLRAGGHLFFTTPFLWPLHDVPYDVARLTPFTFKRLLAQNGFEVVDLWSPCGWHGSLATLIGLWARRASLRPWQRRLIAGPATVASAFLARRDRPVRDFGEGQMISAVHGIARRQP